MSSENELRHATSKKSDGKHEFSHTILKHLSSTASEVNIMFRFSEQSESHAINVAVDFIDKNVTKNAGGKILMVSAAARSSMSYNTSQNVFG